MITYKEQHETYGKNRWLIVHVLLGGKRVGVIRKETDGWRYWPKGSDTGGQLFPSIAAVKKSLESE